MILAITVIGCLYSLVRSTVTVHVTHYHRCENLLTFVSIIIVTTTSHIIAILIETWPFPPVPLLFNLCAGVHAHPHV